MENENKVSLPELQNLQNTPIQKPKNKVKKLIFGVGILVLLLLVVVITGVVYFTLKNKQTPTKSNQNNIPIQAVAFPPSYLVYESISGTPPTSSNTYLLNSSGSATNQFSAKSTDSNFEASILDYNDYFSNPSFALLNNYFTNDSIPSFKILESDGSMIPVSASLDITLEQILTNGGKSNQIFLAGKSTMYVVDPNTVGSNKLNYLNINLANGNSTTLFTVEKLSNTNSYFIPENINPGDNMMSFLVSNVAINNREIAGSATVTYDLYTNQFSVNNLPSNIATEINTLMALNQDNLYTGVSPDGTVVAYQTSKNGFTGSGPYVTNFYNLTSKQNITSTGDSVSLGSSTGTNSYYFSSDDKYVAIVGLDSNSKDSVTQVLETSNGSLVENYDLGKSTTNQINPIGWLDTDTLVYETNTSNSSGLFNPQNEIAHSVNLNSNSSHDFPNTYGQPVFVINHQVNS